MRQGVIKFSKEFVAPSGLKEWVGVEYPVDFDTEKSIETFDKIKGMVVSWFEYSNPDMYSQVGIKIVPVSKEGENSSEDPLLKKAIEDLAEIEYQEDAILYLNNNGWTFNIELKKIANSKPKKITEQ